MIILAIDPGCIESAYIRWNAKESKPIDFDKIKNEDLEIVLSVAEYDVCVIEKIGSYGMAVGAEVFETCFWSGRFSVIANSEVERVFRKTVAGHHCQDARARDANIRQALIDRFGPLSVKTQTGKTKSGKPIYKVEPCLLYGITKDVWSALAVAVWKADQLNLRQGM